MSIIEKFIQRIKNKTAEERSLNIGDYPYFAGWDGEGSVSAESAMRISTVYSCIRVRAESISMLPIRLYEIKKDGSRVKAYNHPLYELMHNEPNQWMTSAEFMEQCCWNLDTYGNFYAYIVRIDNMPVEIIPLAFHSVSCSYKPNSNEPEYIVSVKRGNDTVQLTCSQQEILHIRLQAYDGLHGMSPIAQVNRLMYNANSTENLAGKVYQQGAMNSGCLTTDAKLDKETHKIIREAFYKNYVGSENAGKPMILDSGMKYTQFHISLTDAQFIENRKYDRDEICGVFRIPPHMVANLDHATFSNIEEQNLQFINYSLAPYLRKIEQRLNKQLLPANMKNYRFKFDLTSLLRGSTDTLVNYVKSLLDGGVITINDALDKLDMNKCVGGDIRKLPLNTAYMDSTGKIINPNIGENDE